MMRSSFFTLAVVCSITACTDNPNAVLTGPIDPLQPILPTPSLVTIAGRITVSGSTDDRLVELHEATGTVYRLLGNQTGALASVDGGDVVARGTFDANPGFVVDEFTVTGMRGRPALDGVLMQTPDGGYAVRLRDGSLRAIPGISPECAQHLGARVWVTGFDAMEGVEYGRIAAV